MALESSKPKYRVGGDCRATRGYKSSIKATDLPPGLYFADFILKDGEKIAGVTVLETKTIIISRAIVHRCSKVTVIAHEFCHLFVHILKLPEFFHDYIDRDHWFEL